MELTLPSSWRPYDKQTYQFPLFQFKICLDYIFKYKTLNYKTFRRKYKGKSVGPILWRVLIHDTNKSVP